MLLHMPYSLLAVGFPTGINFKYVNDCQQIVLAKENLKTACGGVFGRATRSVDLYHIALFFANNSSLFAIINLFYFSANYKIS